MDPSTAVRKPRFKMSETEPGRATATSSNFISEAGLKCVGRHICRFRRKCVRKYYQLRNEFCNSVWPTSPQLLPLLFTTLFGLMLIESDVTHSLYHLLWQMSQPLPLPPGLPKVIPAFITTWIVAVVVFVILVTARQYLLRLLLSYQGWMYESGKQSVVTKLWANAVQLVSATHPKLYNCQKILPRQNVPKLRHTLDKLLESMMPLCSKEELADLRKSLDQMESQVGHKLQRLLHLKSWITTNYVTDWWEKYAYLKSRKPLAINSNYYAMDSSYWTPTYNQVSRAANLIHSMMKIKQKIEREQLSTLIANNTIPVCMEQYRRLFSTARIPGAQIDELVHYGPRDSCHIIVSYHGLFYRLDMVDRHRQLAVPPVLEELLETIRKDAQATVDSLPEAAHQVSALTSLPRTEWARIREEHFSQGINRDSLSVIEKAAFVVVLSDEEPTELTSRARWLMYGDCQSYWFDKSVTLTVFRNGHCGLNVEHTMADAPVMGHVWELMINDEILKRQYLETGKCFPIVKTFHQAPVRPPLRLGWQISPELQSAVHQAMSLARQNGDDLDLIVTDHKEWGKGQVKSLCKVSPDAFVQIALQVAYYKENKKFVQTYEASMTRLFRQGRTETVRPCTSEVAKFVRAMVDEDVDREEKISLMRVAATKHQQMYRDAMTGLGIDRHLFTLYVLATGLGYEVPVLGDILMRPWVLSTSQQPQQQERDVPDANDKNFCHMVSPGGGFGPVCDEGYGVSYMFASDHQFFFHVSSKHSCPTTSSQRFLRLLYESMDEMRDLFIPTESVEKKIQ